jgi:glutathione-regulated potassium-efflux system ancillary protein KefF
MILILHAHPYPARSRSTARLLAAVRELPGVEVHSLYDRYPDFDIDIAAEQAALTRADLIVWLHPIYWYSVPAMLKHWFDAVLLRGWAYGKGGEALNGKTCLWVAAAGGDAFAYSAEGVHARPFAEFVPPIEQTARFCGMRWQEPIIVQGSHDLGEAELTAAADTFRARLLAFNASQNPGGVA